MEFHIPNMNCLFSVPSILLFLILDRSLNEYLKRIFSRYFFRIKIKISNKLEKKRKYLTLIDKMEKFIITDKDK